MAQPLHPDDASLLTTAGLASRHEGLPDPNQSLESDLAHTVRLTTGQRQALELAVSGADLSLVLDALTRSIEDAASRRLMASVLLLDPDGMRLRHGAAPSLPDAYNAAIDGIAIGPSVGSCGTAAFTHSPVMVSDIDTDPLWAEFRDLAVAHGLRACWSTPISSSKNVLLGTFAIYYPEPTKPTPHERACVDLLTNTAAIVIERHREAREREKAELALADTGSQLALITDAVPALISYVSPDCRYRLVNKQYEDWFGSREVIIGRTLQEVLGEAAWTKVRPWIVRALGGEAVSYESQLTFADGRTRWVHATYTPDKADDGSVRGVVALVTNVDERRRAAERERFLSEVAHATQPLSDPSDVIKVIARLLAEYLGADRCAYAQIESDSGDMFVITGDHTRDVPSIVGRWPVRAFGEACHRMMLANTPYVVHDTETDERISARDLPAYRATTTRAMICVPLHKQGHFTAAMAVHQAGPRAWTEGEIDLVRTVAARCWESLERTRAIQQLTESETRYRTLFDSIDEGFLLAEVIRDESGRPADLLYLESNPAAVRITRTDYKGRRLLDIDPRYEPYWIEIWGRVASTGVGERHQRYAGVLGLWFDFYVFPVSDKVAVVFKDITAHRNAVQAMSESAQRHSFFVRLGDKVRDLSDPEQIEAAAAELLGTHFGVSRAFYVEYDDRAGLATVHQDHRREDVQSLVGVYRMEDFSAGHAILRSGQALVLNDVLSSDFISASERQGYVQLGIRSIICVSLVKNGQLVGGLVAADSVAREWSTLDVSLVQETAERTWAALERAKAQRALREANQHKDEFLATLAHELRNPLAPIRNGLHILRLTGIGDAVSRKTVDMMDRQLSHLVRLVDDLLDVGRISSGKIELRRGRLALATVLANSIELSRAVLDKHRQRVTLNTGGENLTVDGDFDRLTQVFVNLLSNAAKYSDVPGIIAVTVARDEDMARIQVTDEGIGIAKDDLPYVFDLFSQVRAHKGHADGGLGIGLSLVRKLVNLHGGTVRASSPGPGQGSTFTVTIPLLAAEAPCALEGTGPGGAQESSTTVSRRILIADDNADAAASLAAMLEMLGHEVKTAADGLEAVELAPAFQPHLVLLDLGMPRLDGLGAAKRLRADPRTRNALLVALTGWGLEVDRMRTREAGFDHHLVKPVDSDALNELLRP